MTGEVRSPEIGGRRFRWARWLMIAAGAFLLVAAAGFIALRALFPPEKLRVLVVPRLESALGREVELSSVRLRVFPRIAVRLEDFGIASAAGFSPDPALRLEALDLRVRLGPLFRRQIQLSEVRLVRPDIRIEVSEDGSNNITGPRRSSTPVAGEVAAGGLAAGGAFGFGVSGVSVRDGSISYVDRRSGQAVRLSLDARVSAIPGSETGVMETQGRIDASEIRALIPALTSDTLALPDTRIDYDVFADLPGDSVAIRELRLEVGDVPVSGVGDVHRLMGEREFSFSFESGRFEIERVLAALPGPGLTGGAQLSGTARLSGELERRGGEEGEGGEGGGDVETEVSGTIELSDLSADYLGVERLVSEGAGSVSFSLDSLAVESFEAQLMGRPLSLRLSAARFDDPVITGRVTAEIDLARFAELRELETPLEGLASLDVSISGPPKRPERLRISGPIRLSDVRYESPSLAVPATVSAATIQLTGSGLAIEEMPIGLGGSDITLSLSGPGLLPLAFGAARRRPLPELKFSVNSRRLDLDELLVEDTAAVGYSSLVSARLAGSDLGGRDPAEIARERYALPPLPALEARGRVGVGQLLNRPIEAREVAFDVLVTAGRLEIRNLEGTVYGGSIDGSLRLDFSSARPPFPLNYDFSLAGAEADVFVDHWTRLGSTITGGLDFDISGATAIDDSFLPVSEVTEAKGRATFSNGQFRDFGLTRALVSQLKLDPGFASSFQQLGGAFLIENGAFVLKGWRLETPKVAGDITGSAGLKGSLDLALSLDVPAAVLRDSGLIPSGGGLGNLLNRLAGSNETFEISLGIGGTMSKPIFQLDDRALQAALERELQKAGDDLLKRLFRPPR